MLRCTPFLLFDGNCAEAMTFYRECLGGELSLTRLGDSPMKDLFSPDVHDRLINASLTSGDIEISATDWMASPDYNHSPGNNFSIFVIGHGYDELKTVFDKLAVGAQKEYFQDLHDLPFGSYGQLHDKFGIPWIFKGDKVGSASASKA
jgi:PhnB protein